MKIGSSLLSTAFSLFGLPLCVCVCVCVCVLSPYYFLRQGLPLKLEPTIRLDWLGTVHQGSSPQPCSPKGDFADCSSTKETISPTGFTVVEVGGAGTWVDLSEIIPCLLEGNELLL